MQMKWLAAIVAGAGVVLATPIAQADDVTMDQLPEAVRRTVERELGQAQVGEIERDRDEGRTYYEVEFTENGERFELDVAEDGQVIRRHRD